MIMKTPSTVTGSTGQGWRFAGVISIALLMTDFSLNPSAKNCSSVAQHLVPPFVRALLRDQSDGGEDVHQHSAREESREGVSRGSADLAGHLHQPFPAQLHLAAHVLVGAGGVGLHLEDRKSVV